MYAFLVGVLQLCAAAKARVQHAQLAGLDGNDNTRPEKQEQQRCNNARDYDPQTVAAQHFPYICTDAFH